MRVARPNCSDGDFKRFRSAAGEHVLVVPFSQIYDIDGVAAIAWDSDPGAATRIVDTLAAATQGEVSLDEVPEPAPQSISLNVSSSCNLSCGYCYASRGHFGGRQRQIMSRETALLAVERLLDVGDASAAFTIGFLGGEPFVNRGLIHEVVRFADNCAVQRGLDVRYSVTTNGTLLEAADLDLMRTHSFAVTVSLDGDEAVHERQRPETRAGRRSWSETMKRVRPLLERPGRAQIAARATVTRHALDVTRIFGGLRAVGFRDIGLAPLRHAPAESGPLRDEDWPRYLAELTALARSELEGLKRGSPITLTNLATALKQLARGAASPYPCGAGGGYFSVASDGTWYACHRAVGNPSYALGSSEGIRVAARREFLRAHHVHSQTDCTGCWARYLCSGGCHQEAQARSAASCDFIRGWLEFCLVAYAELSGAPLTRTHA